MATSDMIVVFPANPTPDLARTLDLGGYRWKAVSGADEAGKCEPQAGWMGAIITCDEDPESAWAFARALRKRSGHQWPDGFVASLPDRGRSSDRDGAWKSSARS